MKMPVVISVTVLGILAVGAVALKNFSRGIFGGPPNVILVVVDTLRADHLGFYGYSRPTSPHVDSFARSATAFEWATSASSWTPPSMASILTGLYPTTHGMVPPRRRVDAAALQKRLPENVDTLAELLGREGYKTYGIVSNHWLTEEFGYKQGFQGYETRFYETADKITDAGLEALTTLTKQDKPFFLYLHYLDPHDPYRPPEQYKRMMERYPHARRPMKYPDDMRQLINRYDGEIRFFDDNFGRLIAELKARGVYDDALIVFVSDHGEQFRERGNHGHGYQLFTEETHVPLFVKLPRQSEGSMVRTPVSHVDIVPTVMEVAGSKAKLDVQGLSLLHQAALEERGGVYSEVARKMTQEALVSPSREKIIVGESAVGDNFDSTPKDKISSAYDLNNDQFETKPLEDEPKIENLKSALATLGDSVKANQRGGDNDVEVSESTVESLRSLGYLK